MQCGARRLAGATRSGGFKSGSVQGHVARTPVVATPPTMVERIHIGRSVTTIMTWTQPAASLGVGQGC